MGSDPGPILHVPARWCVVETCARSQWSKAASVARSASVGERRAVISPWKAECWASCTASRTAGSLVCPARLLDHLICHEEQGWGHREPERLGGLEVDD